MGSDHFPVITRVGLEVSGEVEVQIPRLKLDRANWELFQAVVRGSCETVGERTFSDVDVFNDELVSAIIQAAEISIPKTAGKRSRKSVPWWNEKCNQAVRKRNKAFKQVRGNYYGIS